MHILNKIRYYPSHKTIIPNKTIKLYSVYLIIQYNQHKSFILAHLYASQRCLYDLYDVLDTSHESKLQYNQHKSFRLAHPYASHRGLYDLYDVLEHAHTLHSV